MLPVGTELIDPNEFLVLESIKTRTGKLQNIENWLSKSAPLFFHERVKFGRGERLTNRHRAGVRNLRPA